MEALDHIRPYDADPVHLASNLVPSCKLCNSIAGAKQFGSFNAKRRFILRRRQERMDQVRRRSFDFDFQLALPPSRRKEDFVRGGNREGLEAATLALLGRQAKTMSEYGWIGDKLAQAAGRPRTYSPSYVRNLLVGAQPFSPQIEDAVSRLLIRLNAPPMYETIVSVQVAPGLTVVPNAVLTASSRPCVCGVDFVPRVWNQRYHTVLCERLAATPRRIETGPDVG